MYAHWPESVRFIKKCQFMELLSVSWPGFLRTGQAACSEHVKMQGSRSAKQWAGYSVPDRHCKRVGFFDCRHDVNVLSKREPPFAAIASSVSCLRPLSG